MKNSKELSIKNIDAVILKLRNCQVILDSNVAKIYGVETRTINQAVQRNSDKFPSGYIFELSKQEKQEVITKCDNLLSDEIKFSPKPPKAFTEKGLYMLATVLRSKQATQATLQIIETFAKIKEFSKVAKSLATEKDQGEQQKLIKKSGSLIGDILNKEFVSETSSETTIELNLAMIKVKHTIKKSSK